MTRQPGAASQATRIARNALSGAGRFGVSAVVALAVTPYALSVLGADRYGVWAIGGAVLTAIRLLDLGTQRSVVRAIAEAERDPADGRRALATGLGIQLVLGLAWLAVVAVSAPAIVTALAIPAAIRSEATLVIVGTAGVAAVEGIAAQYQAGLDGIGRMDLGNAIDTLQRIASGIGTVVVLAAGFGLAGLVAKNGVTALGALLGQRAVLRRKAPSLGAAGPRLDRRRAGDLLRFGRHVQTVNLSALLVEPINKALLSRFFGLDAVAVFDIATQVISQLGGGLVAFATAVFPEAARRRDAGANMRLWQSAERPVALLALGTFGVTLAVAVPFAEAWLGPTGATVGAVMAVLAVGWAIAVMSVPAFLMAQGSGFERLSTWSALITAFASIGGAVALLQWGVVGVATGRAFGLAAGSLAIWIVLAKAWRREKSGLAVAARGFGAAVLASALAASLAFSPVGESLMGIVAAAGAGCGAYVVALRGMGVVDRADVSRLRRIALGPERDTSLLGGDLR